MKKPMNVLLREKTLEQLYGIKTRLIRMTVPINQLRPTQNKIFADELQGRTYEIERGLAEPTIVVKVSDRYVLVDGHHRTVAALKLGHEEIDSYVIEIDDDLKLGIEKTADKEGIHTYNDIEVIDDAQHPLIALTGALRKEGAKK